MKEEGRLGLYRESREDFGMKTYLHGPKDYGKKVKLRFRVGDLDLPERRKIYTNDREEGDVASNTCPCGTTLDRRTHVVEECEIYRRNGIR